MCFAEVQAGPGCIFNGADVKCLKDNLRFKTTPTRIMTGDSDNPQSVAKSAHPGSLYIQDGTGNWYRKLDTGSSVNWTLMTSTENASVAIDRAWGGTQAIVVGLASDVATGDATHASVTTAVASAFAGDRITLLARITTENVSISKQLHLVGSGSNSIISGTLTFNDGASGSSIERLKIVGNTRIECCNTDFIVDTIWIEDTASFFAASESQHNFGLIRQEE